MAAPRRHYLLYARQTLRDFRVVLAIFTVVYLGIGVYDSVTHHDFRRITQWLISASFPLVVAFLLFLYSRQTYVEFREEGVLVRLFLRSATIPYTDIEKARLETLERIFDRPERKRMQTKTVRALYKSSAVCLRIRADEDLPEVLRRRLGPRTVVEREAVLPITDSDAAMASIKQRLGSRRSQAQAAAPDAPRRRRRPKRR
ncbi:MAG: hypothetical protein ABR573_03435 [Candidatus Dormibacteria bacterium]